MDAQARRSIQNVLLPYYQSSSYRASHLVYQVLDVGLLKVKIVQIKLKIKANYHVSRSVLGPRNSIHEKSSCYTVLLKLPTSAQLYRAVPAMGTDTRCRAYLHGGRGPQVGEVCQGKGCGF